MADQSANAETNLAIGEVQAVSGQVVAIGADGSQRVLAVGDAVFPGDEIRTLGVSNVAIAMRDGSRFELGPDGQGALDEAVYSQDVDAVRVAAEAEVAELQAAIAAGADPGEVTDPPAAGNATDAGVSESAQVADSATQRTGNVGVVEAGFETSAIDSVVSPLVDDVTGLGTTAALAASGQPGGDSDGGGNQAPIVGDVDLGSTPEDTPVFISQGQLLANTSDPDSAASDLVVTSVVLSNPDAGSLTDLGDGNWAFNPAPDFSAEGIEITFSVSDGNSDVDGLAVIDVSPVNDLPDVGDVDLGSTIEDTAVVITEGQLLANTSDRDNVAEDLVVSSSALADPEAGTLTDNGDGTWTFVPAQGFSGEDVEIVFSVSDGEANVDGLAVIDVTSANGAPGVGDVDLGETPEDTPFVITRAELLSNTSLPDMPVDDLVVTSVNLVDPDTGTLTDNGNGTWTYTPVADFSGENVRIVFSVNDGESSATSGAFLDVTPVNDAPAVGDVDLGLTTEDTSVFISQAQLLADTTDPDTAAGDLTVTSAVLADPSNGTLIDIGDGFWVYTPAQDFNGEDVEIAFSVSDGEVSENGVAVIDVLAINDSPVVSSGRIGVDEGSIDEPLGLVAPTDVDGDPLTIVVTGLPMLGTVTRADGSPVVLGAQLANADLTTLQYDAPTQYNGTDEVGSFTYQVDDGRGLPNSIQTGVVDISVAAINEAPSVPGGSLTVDEGSVGTPLGVAAPTDPDGNELTITVTALPALGVLRLDDGTLLSDVSFLTPEQFAGLQYDAPTEIGSGGLTLFGYEVDDGQGQANSVVANSIVIGVDAVNDAPVANADAAVIDPDVASVMSGNVLNNDADPDGPALTVANPGTFVGTFGTLVLSANGSYDYTVDPDAVAAANSGRSDGLVGHWTFEEVISDDFVKDVAPEGTPTSLKLNGATLATDPVYGSVVSLNGSGGMSIPDSTDINTGRILPQRTISLRFKADDTVDRQVLYEEGQNVRGLNIYIEDGELFAGGWNIRESGWQGDWVNLGPVNAGEWNHVALVLDGGETVQPGALSGYLNGVFAGAVPGSQIWRHPGDITVGGSDAQSFYDGREMSRDGHFYRGEIDDLRVYNAALDAEEVQQLADAPPMTLTDTFTYTATDGIEAAAPEDLTIVLGTFNEINSPASGDGILVGTDGNDIFHWQASDAGTPGSPLTDTIENFGADGKDVLDIADLLVDGASGDLTDYLHFDQDGSGNTVVHISSTAGFAGGYDPSVEDQTIVIENFSVSGSDADIIASLVADNTLITG